MNNNSNRVQKHRQGLRAAGYRQIQVWVPDMRRKEFLDECVKQVARVNAADHEDSGISDLMDEALKNLTESGEWH
jgi:G:T-mismatch repair DNA endonuclease (very short patch repair protein)